jgi:restriction endonuclease
VEVTPRVLAESSVRSNTKAMSAFGGKADRHARVASHEVALAGDREQIKRTLIEQGRNERAAIDDARELLDFYHLGSDCLWITLARGHLWWTFATPEVTWLGSGENHGKRMRKAIGGWRNTDINSLPLRMDTLSTKLTKTAGYRRAICAIDCEEYLLRRINGIIEPLVLKANQARQTLTEIIAEAIGSLHWVDFETMVDVIFARSGWHRVSAIGGSQPLVDLALEQPITGERAAVQVKSRARQNAVNDFIDRVDEIGTFDRVFFVCHHPIGTLSMPIDRRDAQLWSGDELARTALRLGLSDWIIEKIS